MASESETIADIVAEMRANSAVGVKSVSADYYAGRIEAAARRAYNEIDRAVCGVERASSLDIDNVRTAMDETIGGYCE